MKIITSEKIPIKMWLNEIEEGALQQAKNLANLPFAFKHIVIMPDSHQGYGMPIGGVLATQDVIIPNAVGVDIGCGMCAYKTRINASEFGKDKANIENIVNQIKKTIPVGFKHHAEKHFVPEGVGKITIEERENASYQIGTLGGGNHFIELQKGSDGYLWVMIHSGSRNVGKKVADYYHKLAVKINESYYSSVIKDLAFLPLDSQLGISYMAEMNYCIDFALANRKLMMGQILDILRVIAIPYDLSNDKNFINIAHNYAIKENHFGRNVLVHRKGATLARKGIIGIIPGSQGTKSYIVEGKGNPQSFNSCSHGAGRIMGRKEASKKLDLKEQIQILDSQGIIHQIKKIEDLDEAPGAYKNIDEVMANQQDLVDILIELTPLAVIKG